MTLMTSPKLIAVGDNCLDVYLTKNLMTVGGNALNVAVHWRRAGWTARYFGAIGRDEEGAVLLEEVAAAGLSRDDVERRPGDTAVTLLRDQNGDRQFLLESLGAGENYMPADAHYRVIAAADWVHLGTNANPQLVRRLVDDRVPFSVDVSTAHSTLPLAGVPLIFASGPDDVGEPVAPVVERLQAAGAKQVVLTCGGRGAYFADGGTLLHVPARPTQVVDTCGAGDCFIATFLANFCCEKRGAEASLRQAAATAAEVCTYLGGFPQMPRPIPDWLLRKYAAYTAAAAGR
jgi:fructoselysine 6-kinase